MISIIVPVHKVEQCLTRCIDSILQQSYTVWELILVDDGSPDRSGEICDQYAQQDARIKAIHQQNQGVSAARNHGIILAKGEYITFVDSDDYLDKEFLSSFDLQNGADLQVQGMVSTYPDRDNQRLLPTVTNLQSMSVCEALSCSDNVKFLFSPWAKLFRTSILRDHSVSFPMEICYTEDEVFVKRFLTHASCVQMISQAHYYYTHDTVSSLSGRDYGSDELFLCLSLEHQTHLQFVTSMNCGLPKVYEEVYIRRKAYLVYRMLHKMFHETNVSNEQILSRINLLKSDYMQQLRYLGDLPNAYRMIRFILLKIPAFLCVSLLRLLVR